MYPSNLLEVCQTFRCKKKVHYLCQMEFEHGQNIDAGLSKKCMHCLMSIVDKQNSGMEANRGDISTSATARGQTFTVNVHMHTNSANQNADFKSSAKTSRQTNEKNSTPCINNLNK
eukprot:12171068-Ditylum_brightwellii.AAC.1